MTGILITARLGSQRLPRKHLISAFGKSFIEWLVLRYQHVFKNELSSGRAKIILATTTEPADKDFEKTLSPYGINVFQGSVDNIPKRHLDCADQFQLTHIISVDGDDILCSAEASLKILEFFKTHPNKDLVSVSGLPLGMNSSGYSVKYLRACLENAQIKKAETGWGRIFIDPDKEDIRVGNYDIHDPLRFTLDYEDDARFFSAIINYLGDRTATADDNLIIETVKQQGFDQINKHLYEIYWNNYNQLKSAETDEL